MPLEKIQQSLSWLGILTNTSKRDKIFRSVAVTAVEICMLAASATFLLKNVSFDLEASLNAVLQLSATGSLTYMLLSVFTMHNKIHAMFEHLTDIYNSRESTESYQYIQEINSKIEWMWQMYMKYWLIGFAINSLAMATFSALACSFMYGIFDKEHLYHSCMLSLPWNQETPLGYFGEILFATITSEVYLFGNGSFILLFVSLCLHHQAFLKIFKHSLKQLRSSPDHHRNAKKEQLCELIRFHNSLKGLFLESAEIYSPIIMIQLICSMIYVAVSVFQLNLQMEQINFGMTTLVIVSLTGLSNLFVYCYFGKLATDSFIEMSDCLFEFDWQDLPIGLQKYFLLMIQNTQRPVFYHGFGVVYLHLETFTKFIKTVYTFFMMFKKITSQ